MSKKSAKRVHERAISGREKIIRILDLVRTTALIAMLIYSAYLCCILTYYIVEGVTFPFTYLGSYVQFVVFSVSTITVLVSIALVSFIARRVLQQRRP